MIKSKGNILGRIEDMGVIGKGKKKKGKPLNNNTKHEKKLWQKRSCK
jgi:hypothetical protein